MSGCCSKCGTYGHHTSCTCTDSSSGVAACDGGGSGEIMLFGVRVKVDPMRKSVSLNNLSQYEQPHEVAADNAATATVVDAATAGYASADEAINRHSSGGRERKRGVPWTEEEHKWFLLGLQKVGKGDWRGISRNFVKTRTPTQVASHAQKYFLRKNNLSRRRRRSSLFDITTDSVINREPQLLNSNEVTAIPMEEERVSQDSTNQPVLIPQSGIHEFPSGSAASVGGLPATHFTMTMCPVLLPVHIENPMENLTLEHSGYVINPSRMLVRSIPVLPVHDASSLLELSSNQKSDAGQSPLSLKLSLSSDQNQLLRSSFNSSDNIISVA